MPEGNQPYFLQSGYIKSTDLKLDDEDEDPQENDVYESYEDTLKKCKTKMSEQHMTRLN